MVQCFFYSKFKDKVAEMDDVLLLYTKTSTEKQMFWVHEIIIATGSLRNAF